MAEEPNLPEGYTKATCGVGCVFSCGEAQSGFRFLKVRLWKQNGRLGARWFGPSKRVRLQVRVERL